MIFSAQTPPQKRPFSAQICKTAKRRECHSFNFSILHFCNFAISKFSVIQHCLTHAILRNPCTQPPFLPIAFCASPKTDLQSAEHKFGKTTHNKIKPSAVVAKGFILDYSVKNSYSSVFLRVARRRFGFSSATLFNFSTPANSGSIMMRPQYSQTIIFLRIRISN